MAETAKDTVYKPHSVPKSYTNYSGLELPEVDQRSQTFLKPLLRMGVSGSMVHIKTTAIPLHQIYSTSALTAGNSISLEINQYRTVSSSSGRDWGLKVNMVSSNNAKFPGGVNAVYGSMTLGTGGAHGRAAAIQAEIVCPDGSFGRGSFSCFHADVTVAAGSNWASAGPFAWTSYIAAGTMTHFNANALFFTVTGLTAAADALLSLTSQTLKVGLGVAGTTTRYLVMSQMQDGLGLGNTTTHMVLTASSTRAVDIYTDYTGTGPTYAINIDSTLGGTGVRGGIMYSCATWDAIRPGSYSLNTFIKSDFTSITTTAGFGMGNALMVELVNPTAAWGGGEFHVLALEWTGASATAMHGNAGIPSSFIKFEAYGTAEADIDDHGYLFYLSGFSAADHHLVDNSNTDIDFIADVLIKINIGGTEYWLGACDNEAGTS